MNKIEINAKEILCDLIEVEKKCQNDHLDDAGLLCGLSGRLLFRKQYLKYTHDDELFKCFEKEIKLLLECSIDSIGYSLCNGKAGINWFYSHLLTEDILEKDDFDILYDDFESLNSISLNLIEKNNYDILHGALGIAYCSLYYQYDTLFTEKILDLLKNLMNDDSGMFKNFDNVNSRTIENEINFGLAHGLPSIIKFCLECIKKDINEKLAKEIANEIIDFIINHSHTNQANSFFGYVLKNGQFENNYSRLAWCYGDLGIGYILYQAGITFNDQKVIDFALEVLYHSTHRRTVEETLVFDAGICHGSAGVAHIYNRMWHYTKDPVFKEATDFWIQKTLDFAVHEDGVAGYKKYNPTTKAYENDYGLLEGAAGIGLVLLSYITGDFSWDYCLMLND